MRVRQVMTQSPVWCTPDTSLSQVARMMVEHDCGEIPVCERGEILGVITDRDITCRATARGKSPLETTVRSVMTTEPYTVSENADINDAVRLMEQHRIRRLPVTREGKLVGMLSQSDLIHNLAYDKVLELLTAIQRPAVYA